MNTDTPDIDNLLSDQGSEMAKLQRIVKNAVKSEKLITQQLLNPPAEILTVGQKISDKVARFGGSWRFILIFSAILIIWILFNVLEVTSMRFDPYPFILMNLVLSCVAALQAPIIMMSQNRHEEKDRKQNQNDYMINLKSELEIKSLHEKLDLLLDEHFKILTEAHRKQLEQLAELRIRLDKIESHLGSIA